MSRDQIGDWIENHSKENGMHNDVAASIKQMFKDRGVDGNNVLKLDRDYLRNTIGITKFAEMVLVEEAISKLKLASLLPWQRNGTHVDSNEWEEDLEKTEYANELLNTIEEFLPNDVHRYPLTRFLQSNEENACDLFTRKCQRELWNEVLMYLETTHKGNALVTGNPGIGKSRSMAYLLRLLLQKGKTVIYEARKDNRVYAFIPPSGHDEGSKYKVWISKYSTWLPEGCVALQNSSNFCLIDPDMPSGIVGISAHIVLSASPNRAHFKEFVKLPRTPTWCMPIWKKEELKALQPYISIEEGVKLTDDEFESRYFDFGGRIRFIYAIRHDYDDYWDTLKESVQDLGFPQLTKALVDGLIQMNQSNEGTPSMLFVYDVLGLENTYSSITYKYKRGTPGNVKLLIGSVRIRQLLCACYWMDIMNLLNPKRFSQSRNDIANGRLFELVASVYLEFAVELNVRNNVAHDHKQDHKLDLPQGVRREFKGTWSQYIGECSKLPTSADTIATGIREIVIPSAANQPVLDMMDACDRAYQFAVGMKHGVNLRRLKDIVETLKLTPHDPLKLYFVIPECNTHGFEWSYTSQSGMDKKTRDSVKNCVKISVVCIPKDPGSNIQEMIDLLRATK